MRQQTPRFLFAICGAGLLTWAGCQSDAPTAAPASAPVAASVPAPPAEPLAPPPVDPPAAPTPVAPDPAQAFQQWTKQTLDTYVAEVPKLAETLKPVTYDIVSEKASSELIANLVAKYGPVLTNSGADYVWCKKTWTLKGKLYSSLISPQTITEFYQSPVNCAPLADPRNVMDNKQATLSAAVALFFDLDKKEPVVVITMRLAPPVPPAVEGGPQAVAVPPTDYTLWYYLSPPPAAAQAHLEKMLAKPAGVGE